MYVEVPVPVAAGHTRSCFRAGLGGGGGDWGADLAKVLTVPGVTPVLPPGVTEAVRAFLLHRSGTVCSVLYYCTH